MEARCPCGSVMLELRGEPLGQVYYHCDDCQRAHGAAYVPRAIFPRDAVSISSGVTGSWVNRTRTMIICTDRGSHLYGEQDGSPFRGVDAALFPDGKFMPQAHCHCQQIMSIFTKHHQHNTGLPSSVQNVEIARPAEGLPQDARTPTAFRPARLAPRFGAAKPPLRHSAAKALSALLLVAGSFAASPATARDWVEPDFGQTPLPRFNFAPPGSSAPTQTVVGETKTHHPTAGDTFFDLARFYDLGHNEIEAANPGIDEWIPDQSGKEVAIPTAWVLPCCTYEGLVINIPEMRIYYYPRTAKGEPRQVITAPVGLGRLDWRTPTGRWRVTEKTKDPTWVLPESIRKERIAEKGFSETSIPGGHPDNPLGHYRMRISLDIYGIHGTHRPWGVGMLVSHGCVRLYPEDIEKLYPLVPLGTGGEFVYQTVKVGERNGRVWLEAHPDLYGTQPAAWRETRQLLEKQGLLKRVDEERVFRVLQERRGIPVDVTGIASASVLSDTPAMPETVPSTVGGGKPTIRQ